MEKFINPFPGNKLIITQVNHGDYWKNMSFDFGHTEMLAPIDGEVVEVHKEKDPLLNWFKFKYSNNAYIEVVHANPTRTGKFKAGEKIANATSGKTPAGKVWPVHFHLTVIVNNKSFVIVDMIDRNTVLATSGPFTEAEKKKYTSWSTYSNLNVFGQPIVAPQPPPFNWEAEANKWKVLAESLQIDLSRVVKELEISKQDNQGLIEDLASVRSTVGRLEVDLATAQLEIIKYENLSSAELLSMLLKKVFKINS